MDSKVSFKEIFFIIGIILSFAITAIFISQENYQKSLITLTCAAAFVTLEFWAALSDNSSRVIDLRGAGPRTAKKNKGKVTTYNSLTKEGASNSFLGYDGDLEDVYTENGKAGDEFYESVGNLRVYKRGEKIDRRD